MAGPAASRADLHGFAEGRGIGWVHEGAGSDAGGSPVLGWLRAELAAREKVGRARVVISLRAEVTSDSKLGVLRLDPLDRSRRRALLGLREGYARLALHPLADLDLGRFELGWGKTDGYSPSDSFLPRDLTYPFADEKLPLTGVRLRGQRGALRYEVLGVPLLTPWRLPPIGGRYTPVDVPGAVLVEGRGSAPRPGFAAVRLLATHGAWDLGAWARAGVRPAPLLMPRLDLAVRRPDGLVAVPLDRRYVHERALGVEVSRVLGGWVLRGEAAPVFSDDADLGTALLLSAGLERGLRAGTLLVTLAANARDERLDPALLLDRSFLPGIIVAWSGDVPWGSYRLVVTEAFRKGDGLVKAEVVHKVDDLWAVTYGADAPFGPRSGALGALRDATHVRIALRRSW